MPIFSKQKIENLPGMILPTRNQAAVDDQMFPCL
jgi:hypothetical protein